MKPALLAALILPACLRVVSTYWTFNHTIDEPTHIACGLEWLQDHRYTYEYQHPPLSRVLVAMGPWLLGTRNIEKKEDLPSKNPLLLYNAKSYETTLASARAGSLPFLILAAAAVFLWAKNLHGEAPALWAAALFLALPPVLAHAALATTDASLMAILPWSLYALDCWLERPSPLRSAAFGIALALGILSKFSFFLFFPACALPVLILRFRKLSFQAVLLTGLAAFTVTWAGYRFSLEGGVPLRELYLGLLEVRDHNAAGHQTFLLGETGTDGWWYFFPVVFFYKTPLAFLIFASASACLAFRERASGSIPLLCAVCLMLAVLPSRINLGVRHILPIYPLLAIAAGFATHRLLRAARIPCLLLLAWFFGASIAAHPDYLAYFNELAFGEPQEMRVDSDLDWGQNVARLARRLKEKGVVEPVGLALFSSADLSRHGLNWYPVSPWHPATGWVAVSATEMNLLDPQNGRTPWAWLQPFKPVETIGGSVFLYHIATENPPPGPRSPAP